MKMDSRGVLNAISSCSGMVLDVLVVIISCASNRTTTNRRGDCSKKYFGFDLSPSFVFVYILVGRESIRNGDYRTLFISYNQSNINHETMAKCKENNDHRIGYDNCRDVDSRWNSLSFLLSLFP